MEKLRYDGNQISSWDKCDWRPKEAAKPKQGTPKLSEAIRIGARIAIPDPGVCYFSDDTGRACLIGLALVGHTGNFKKACALRFTTSGTWGAIKNIFGFDSGIDSPPRQAERDFMFGKKTVEQCADWLESKGC